MLMDLGLVDFDLGVPLFCPAAPLLLSNSHLPRQNWADSGTVKIPVNPTQSTSRWNTLYMYRSRLQKLDADRAHHRG